MGIIIDGTTGIDLGHTPVNNGTNYEVEGNLNLSGVGARITGDFSNATDGNRVSFETSTLNSFTVVSSFPNGTGLLSAFRAFNTTQGLNSSFTEVYCDQTKSMIRAGRTGTGTYQPMTFTVGGTERMRIDTAGNVLVAGGGGIGYGTGSGGTVTQATSKETSVTLNKPTGTITMSNAALAPNVKVSFLFNNSLISRADTLLVSVVAGSTVLTQYEARARCAQGIASIVLSHTYPTSLSDAVVIKFDIIKGAES